MGTLFMNTRWFTSTVITFAFAFFVGRVSVLARGSMIDTPCSRAGMVSMNMTSRRNVRSMSEFMSIDAFEPPMRLECLFLRLIRQTSPPDTQG